MVLSIAKEFDQGLTVQDRIRLKLNQFGEKHVSITLDELASQLSLPTNSVYQALTRLRKYGEIDLEKESQDNGRDRIVGITINKLEPSTRTYNRRSGKVHRIRPALQTIDRFETVDGIPMLPETADYLNKKLAVQEMRQRAQGAGLDASVISFEPNPLGEEAAILLKLYTDLRAQYNTLADINRNLGFDLEAEKRNVEYLKGKVQQETQEELRAIGRTN